MGEGKVTANQHTRPLLILMSLKMLWQPRGHVWHGLPAIEGSEDKDVLQLQGPQCAAWWVELARTCLTLIKLEHQSLTGTAFPGS